VSARCPSCHHDNRPDRRFCTQCGTTLAVGCPFCGAPIEVAENFCGCCGAATSAATISRFRWRTRRMSIFVGPVTIPKSVARWTRSATLALQISFLLGMQLMLGHEPPIHRRSTTAVRCPAAAISQARSFPPAPLPRMRISYCSVAMTILLTRLLSDLYRKAGITFEANSSRCVCAHRGGNPAAASTSSSVRPGCASRTRESS